MVIGKPAKPRYGFQIHVFRLKELFFTKKKNFKKMAHEHNIIFCKKNFFFFSIKNRSILGLRQKYFFLPRVVLVMVISKPAKPCYDVQINVFRLKELFFTKKKFFF
jgi:hypothetical protein